MLGKNILIRIKSDFEFEFEFEFHINLNLFSFLINLLDTNIQIQIISTKNV
jgi:hypothetical protein